jgi:cell division transport system permease protein
VSATRRATPQPTAAARRQRTALSRVRAWREHTLVAGIQPRPVLPAAASRPLLDGRRDGGGDRLAAGPGPGAWQPRTLSGMRCESREIARSCKPEVDAARRARRRTRCACAATSPRCALQTTGTGLAEFRQLSELPRRWPLRRNPLPHVLHVTRCPTGRRRASRVRCKRSGSRSGPARRGWRSGLAAWLASARACVGAGGVCWAGVLLVVGNTVRLEIGAAPRGDRRAAAAGRDRRFRAPAVRLPGRVVRLAAGLARSPCWPVAALALQGSWPTLRGPATQPLQPRGPRAGSGAVICSRRPASAGWARGSPAGHHLRQTRPTDL